MTFRIGLLTTLLATSLSHAADLNGPWYTASNNGTPAISHSSTNAFDWGSLSVSSNTALTGMLWSYFDEVALTNDYQYIEISFDLLFKELPTASANAIRFGLFHAGGSRVEESLNGSNTDSRFEPSRGYWAGWPPGTGGSANAQLLARTGPRNNPLSGTASAVVGQAAFQGGVSQTDIFYPCSFYVRRNDSTNFTLRSTFNGLTNLTQTALLGTNAFDYAALQNTSQSNVDAFSLTNITLTAGIDIPPPPPPPLDLSGRPNVLLICVDDLRPEIGAYGESHMVTPNLDQFAEQGRLFRRHYVQSPTCGASRYAMLTGRRFTGTDSGNHNNDVLWSRRPQNEPIEAWAIPDMFRRAGYQTIGMGKISHSADCYHYGSSLTEYPTTLTPEMPYSWSDIVIPPSFVSKWQTGWRSFFAYADGSTRTPGESPPFEIGIATNDAAPLYPDIDIADAAVQRLQSLGTNRFFMSVGFFKPHLPFNAPQEFFALYDTNSLPFSPSPEQSIGIDSRSNSPSGEPRNNYGHPGQPSDWHDRVDTEYHMELRRAYFACVSFIDAQIGKVLDEVNHSPLATNTVVMIWGDHGWHLGDNNLWGKHTKFERAARSALIIRTPDMPFKGHQTDAIVESVDLFPTLAELCDLPPPSHLDGISLVPVLDDPRHPGKDAAITYWTDCSSLRTDTHRMVYYHNNSFTEVFDHAVDPWEQTNVVATTDAMVVSNHVSLVMTNAPTQRAAADYYTEWLDQFFTPTELLNTNLVGETANPDMDLFTNLEEYLHGLNPRQATFETDLRGVMTNGAFAAQWRRSLGATDLHTTVEFSSDLKQWKATSADSLSNRVERVVHGTVERLTVKDPSAAANPTRRYSRLRLTK
jgi:arylsulfatase A-like enzyme